jgi:hypothetical protein
MRFGKTPINALITLTVDVSRRVYCRKINHKDVINLATGEIFSVSANKGVTETPGLPADMVIGMVGGEVCGLIKIPGGRHFEVIELLPCGGRIVSAAEVTIMEKKNEEGYIINRIIQRELKAIKQGVKRIDALMKRKTEDDELSLSASTLEIQKALISQGE